MVATRWLQLTTKAPKSNRERYPILIGLSIPISELSVAGTGRSLCRAICLVKNYKILRNKFSHPASRWICRVSFIFFLFVFKHSFGKGSVSIQKMERWKRKTEHHRKPTDVPEISLFVLCSLFLQSGNSSDVRSECIPSYSFRYLINKATLILYPMYTKRIQKIIISSTQSSALENFFQKKHPRGTYSKHYSSRVFNTKTNAFSRHISENKYKKHRSKGDIPKLDGHFTHNQLKQLSRLYS